MSEVGDKKMCMTCKHFAQGSGCSFCANEKQTDSGLKSYSYWPFGTNCKIYENGIHKSRVDFMNSREKGSGTKIANLYK